MTSHETLRSAGVAPTAATIRRLAWATYEPIYRGAAVVEIQYLGAPDAFTMFRVEVRHPGPDVNGVDWLYEAAYKQACAAARIHGYELERFAQVAS